VVVVVVVCRELVQPALEEAQHLIVVQMEQEVLLIPEILLEVLQVLVPAAEAEAPVKASIRVILAPVAPVDRVQ